ncbi:hypothetical protein DPEC_G00308920 [Dallia pectoralis]|uniref:Uncharacterized protein n=1 Tax=Dallia pectoralis TaxID=75939 RepID=A0ACC2FET2_DALPE|nr:hypothetical protein DPEC_G00308920 [Dallia pectoralis]
MRGERAYIMGEHCMVHPLELAFSDAIKFTPMSRRVKYLLSGLHTFYHTSTLTRAPLDEDTWNTFPKERPSMCPLSGSPGIFPETYKSAGRRGHRVFGSQMYDPHSVPGTVGGCDRTTSGAIVHQSRRYFKQDITPLDIGSHSIHHPSIHKTGPPSGKL